MSPLINITIIRQKEEEINYGFDEYADNKKGK